MATLSDITRSSNQWITPQIAVFAVFLLSLPLWIRPIGLYQYIGIEIAIWIIFALGFNLLLGYTGLPSFGHGAFLGIGGYAMGWFQLYAVPNLWLGLVFAVVITALFGAAVALFVSHRRGIYYALLTLAFGIPRL